MKTIKLILFGTFTLAVVACSHKPTIEELKNFAATEKISGNWLITKVNVDGKEQGVYTRIDFLENGDMEVSGRNMGTWTYNQKKKVINIVSAKFKELNGTSEVKEINESELIIENNGARIFFVKLDKQKITNDNLASGLIGTWQIVDDNNPDVTKLITFKAPDIVTTVEWEPGMESTSEGTWIFDPRKMSLLIMGRLSDFGGENKGTLNLLKQISMIRKATIDMRMMNKSYLGKILIK